MLLQLHIKDLILELLLALPLTLLSMSPVKFLLGFKNYNCCLHFVTQPHAAYSPFIHRLINKWLFITQTISDIVNLFKSLEECIQCTFIPAVTGHPAWRVRERSVCSSHLYWWHGYYQPRASEFSASNKLMKPLRFYYLARTDIFISDAQSEQFSIKKKFIT